MSAVGRRPFVGAALLGAALVLTACGGQPAGSAATIGDSRITEQALTTEVQAALAAQGLPVDTADAALTAKLLGRMIVVDLVNTVAAREGVAVSQGRIDEQVASYVAQAGDHAAMEQTFADQGVAPSQIEGVIRLNIQAGDLGVKLDPAGTVEQQGEAVFNAITALSGELGVTASPRFGTWDAQTLQIGPTPDDLAILPSFEQ